MIVVAEIAALFVLLALSGFFSSAETAVFSLSPLRIHRIRRHRPKAAARIEQILGSPTQVLSSILIGNTLVNVAAADIGYVLAERFFPPYGETIAIPLMTVLILIFGEITPKRIAVRYPEALAVRYIPALRLLVGLCAPARLMLDGLTRLLSKQFRPGSSALTEAELLTAVDVGHEEGVLTREERMMIDGIIRLENLQAADVMTPRVDLVGIDLESDPATQVEIARRARFRYLPVYRRTLDRVEGFLDVRRFLLSPDHDLRSAMYPHFYVPDTAPLDTLLTLFQQQDRRLAIVIDEYGGTAGLITRGDILEEIVKPAGGDAGQPAGIEPSGPNRWLVDGNVSLEEINYELDLRLQAEGADRVAGWFTAHAERIPKTGDGIEAQGCRATVMQMRRHRITTVQIERLAPAPEEAAFP